MTPTTARLTFLRHAGFDLNPERAHIHHLIKSGWTTAMLADTYGVSQRTIQRFLVSPYRCPGDRCLTMTPGGRPCHFCRRTEALA